MRQGGGAAGGYTGRANGGRHDAHPRGMPRSARPRRRRAGRGRVPAAARGRAHDGRTHGIYARREATTPPPRGRVPAEVRGRAHDGRTHGIYARREVTTPACPIPRPAGCLPPLAEKGRSLPWVARRPRPAPGQHDYTITPREAFPRGVCFRLRRGDFAELEIGSTIFSCRQGLLEAIGRPSRRQLPGTTCFASCRLGCYRPTICSAEP